MVCCAAEWSYAQYAEFTAEIITVQSGLYVVLLAVICKTNGTYIASEWK